MLWMSRNDIELKTDKDFYGSLQLSKCYLSLVIKMHVIFDYSKCWEARGLKTTEKQFLLSTISRRGLQPCSKWLAVFSSLQNKFLSQVLSQLPDIICALVAWNTCWQHRFSITISSVYICEICALNESIPWWLWVVRCHKIKVLLHNFMWRLREQSKQCAFVI